MKLLIITQRVDINDDNLGLFHRWLEKFSDKLEEVYVICLWQGEYDLPKNVHVFSLGKERGVSKIGQFVLLQKHLLEILPKVDGVFVHMCPIYAVAAWALAKIFRRKMILWFLHREVHWQLKLAEKCVAKILTASKESCQLKNRRKIEIVGHGVDADFFKPLSGAKHQESNTFRIISVGRISPIKDLLTLIKAMDILIYQKKVKDIEMQIIGTPLGEDEEEYQKKLKEEVSKVYKLTPITSTEAKNLSGRIITKGKPHREMAGIYQQSNLLVNLSPTGGMDKVVLEAMACAIPVLVCNETFRDDFGGYADVLIFQEKNPQDLAQKILNLKNLNAAEIGNHLRDRVVQKHNLDNLLNKIINVFQE